MFEDNFKKITRNLWTARERAKAKVWARETRETRARETRETRASIKIAVTILKKESNVWLHQASLEYQASLELG